MHCLLTITQSTLVPSPGCNCAGGQSPDSAHPFPEGELWKPKTPAIPSLLPPLILCFCLSLPLSLSPSPSLWPVTWQRACIKGNYRTMQGASQEFEELFFFKQEFHMAEFCHILGGPSQQSLEPETKEKKQRRNPNKAMFNCNSLSSLVKHYGGKENFSIPLFLIFPLTVK